MCRDSGGFPAAALLPPVDTVTKRHKGREWNPMSDDLDPVIRALEARIAELEAERRPARRGASRLLRRVAVGLVALALLVPGVVLASHQFTDVPTSHTFHNDIDWLADAGVTGGCGSGRFCPNAAVTRGQMAAFMHRLSNEFELVQTNVDPSSATVFSSNATCPSGKRAIAGGGQTDNVNLFMTDSLPDGNTWAVRWETDDNATQDPGSVQVFALCVPRQ